MSSGSSSCEPIDERRAVLVQKRHEADRALLRVAAGKGERARARMNCRRSVSSRRFAAWIILPWSVSRSCCMRPSVDFAAPSSVGSSAGNAPASPAPSGRRSRSRACGERLLDVRRDLRFEQLVQRRFVLRLQRFERQLVLRRGSGSPPNRGASPTRADTSAASARRNARRPPCSWPR